ncbi:MAG: hypothetical protein HZA06_06650, partial [Nitrospirae bacterium]|nr:hypothetical protein [Nitrospirota bacterium]
MADWKVVIKDAVIILVLIFIGTFVLVAVLKSTGAQKLPGNTIAALNILLGSV